MRVLFTGPASAGHLFPMVPTAQALRSAGHDVLFAMASPMDPILNSGIPVTEIGDGTTIKQLVAEATQQGESLSYLSRRSQDEILDGAAVLFAKLSRATVDGLLDTATAWGADVLVYDSFQPAAPLVAAKLGIPSVVHNFGVASGHAMIARLARNFTEAYETYQVEGPARPIALDVLPASLGGDGDGWRVRYVPYNGGGAVPSDLRHRGERPRIAVTLGTVLTQVDGVNAIVQLAEAAAGVDADFLLAVGGTDLSPLGELPPNVKPLPWVPLAELLRVSDALVHHGGSGTMMTAVVAGVPQLILPQGADHFGNADAAVKSGFALSAGSADVDAKLLGQLLTDPALAAGAQQIQAENAAMPSPADLVANFEQLV
ncbi:UDP:flavonoid glycosyltransferase YjiC (YdhE family) [Kitasatospora sp. MAA4]|uniref:nucleotide disphospho-sugar-binding domain-containing protein n=1 Tax=Kitasatospora sp. MAA4 TaxID=3035093 RepID=UPI0024740815|nr:nucleotide disphospho-sugar-binding domain-containing protein [Kitasatospora sp. MAA4]MDH6132311.1 UDP:flavonoid glycosyltransferase YjiC (YdhE family) [Kitasatospora sp. MAA4]